MKKLLLALLGITLIVTLAACGSSEEESNVILTEKILLKLSLVQQASLTLKC